MDDNRGNGAEPQVFGPVKPHLTDHREDHSRGWSEWAGPPEGTVPRLREAPRTTLAQRFRERAAEGERAAGER